MPGPLLALLLPVSAAAPAMPAAGADAAAAYAEALPSGLDLLYGDRVAVSPDGEPVVSVGLATGETRVRLRSRAPLHVDFWEASIQKRAVVRPGDAVDVVLRRAAPAARRTYVDLEGVPFGDAAALARALAGWRARGYPAVSTLEEGLVLGMRGRVLDNREYRLILDTKSVTDAERLSREVYERFGVHVEARTRLTERPWGELIVRAAGAPLGVATSYVRATAPAAQLQVDAVEHAKGYAWHGREDRSYRGEIYVAIDPSGKLAVVNVLGVEAILLGVVPAELFASSPAEALKAQAVAARNHLLAKLGRRHHGDPFHICSEQHCQVYAGVAREHPAASAAVRATAGEVLFHGTALVECAYSASCGGHTEDSDVVWGAPPNPSLRGRADFDVPPPAALAPFADALTNELMPRWIAIVPDSYCARATSSRPERLRWSRRFSAAELGRLVAAAHPGVGTISDLVVEDRGPGGRIASLRIVGSRGSATVLRELAIRRLFGNLSSGAFVIEATRDATGALTAVTFRGAGWGHGVGMCQLGAVGRAEAGHDYRRILGHYFDGAEVVRLYGPSGG